MPLSKATYQRLLRAQKGNCSATFQVCLILRPSAIRWLWGAFWVLDSVTLEMVLRGLSVGTVFRVPCQGSKRGSLGQCWTMQSLSRVIANNGPRNSMAGLIPPATFLWPTWHPGWKDTRSTPTPGAHRPQLPSSPVSRLHRTHSKHSSFEEGHRLWT